MKERLTGAIILVVLIVLLVPELLSGPKGPSAPVPAGAAPTSSEEPPLRSYTINLGDDSHARSASADSGGPGMPQPSGPEQPTVQPGAVTSDAAQGQSDAADVASQPGASQRSGAPQAASSNAANSSEPRSQAAGAPQRSQAASSTASQVGASQASNARPQSSTPTARPGEAATPPQRTVTPAQKPTAPPTAAAPRSEPPKPAHAAALEKPAKPHPAATASNVASTSESPPGSPARSWAVQLGVFASRENAERLAVEVRVKGFKVSVSPVTGGSRKLYKVRVGPTPDRAAAQDLQGRLKAVGRPGGTVVPYS